jgi:hypothetical protein
VTVRHVVLSIGALLVLGLGVYLLVEVRAQTAPVTAHAAGGSAGGGDRPTDRAVDRGADRGIDRAPDRAPDRGHQVDRTPHVPPPLPPLAAPPPLPAPPAAPAPPVDEALAGPRFDAMMDEANRAYDGGELDSAKAMAARLLAVKPTNVRMLRIMVSASCIDGDSATAQASFIKLPAPDQAQMRIRCARYGMSFPTSPDGK